MDPSCLVCSDSGVDESQVGDRYCACFKGIELLLKKHAAVVGVIAEIRSDLALEPGKRVSDATWMILRPLEQAEEAMRTRLRVLEVDRTRLEYSRSR